MLTRMYIDNFLCFTNLELSLAPLTLLLGNNGSGKTSIIEMINLVRSFVIDGLGVDQLAPTSSLTRWDNRDEQMIHLGALVDNDPFEYELVI